MKNTILSLVLGFISLVALGQDNSSNNSGVEYRSRTNGNWSDVNTWQYKDGANWKDLKGSVPQENNGSTWLIRATHTVTYPWASHAMPFKDNLTIGEQGKLHITTDGSINNPFEIQGQWTIYGRLDMNKPLHNVPYLKISEKGILTIKHTGLIDLDLCGLTTDKASSLVIESEDKKAGSLIFSEGNAKATVERSVVKGRWNMIAPPTEGNTGRLIYETNPGDSWLLWFDESKGLEDEQGLGWEYITNLDDPLLLGQGYNYWPDVDETIAYKGTIRSENLKKTLKYSGDELGFNLIGNPYTSAIIWNADNNKWNLKNVEATIWIWDGKSYQPSPQNLSQAIIPMGQGFFVRANKDKGGKSTIQIKQKAKVHHHQDFHKDVTVEKDYNYLSMTIQNNNGHDKVFIYFDEEATDDFDNGYDASKMFGDENIPQLYLIEDERNQTYDFLPLLYEDETRTINMSYKAGTDGEQTLTADFSHLKSMEVTLEDLLTGNKQTLKNNNTYRFIGAKNDDPDRFLLHFKEVANAISEDIKQTSNIHIYSFQKDIYISSSQEAIKQSGEVFIYDLTGRLLQSDRISSGDLVKISVNAQTSYLIVKVVKDGFTETSQILIK